MLDYEKLTALARDCGFTEAGPLDVSTLEFLPEVRDMCAADRCHNYCKSWSCPPAAPSLEEMREKVQAFREGILVQTVGELEDSYDFEGMEAAAKSQTKAIYKLWDALEPEYPGLFPMGTGGCTRCAKCTYPDAPCRFPDRMAYSMEACGLYVSKVCVDNGMKYNYGPNTLAYTACFLLK